MGGWVSNGMGENVSAGMDEPGLRIHKNEEPYGSIALRMRREKGISEFSIAPYLKPRDSVRRIATMPLRKGEGSMTITPLAGGTRPVSAHLVITQIQ